MIIQGEFNDPENQSMKILLFFLFSFFSFFPEGHTETTRSETGIQSHHSISDEQLDCQSRFVRYKCQKMIDASPEVPREYFLNCSETGKQIKVACLKAAGEEVVVGAATGVVLYGAAKGLGLLGISLTGAKAAAIGVTVPLAIVVGVGYGVLRAVESADKSCRKKNEAALRVAWLVFASYHDKKLADSYKRSNTCARFLSIARRKTQKILGQIQTKKTAQERHEETKKFIEEKSSSNPKEKERHLRNLSRKYPKFKRELNEREKRFLSSLKKIQKGEVSVVDEEDSTTDGEKKEDIEGVITRLKKQYQCSSGQYLAELACGNIAAIGSMVTGGVGTAVVKGAIQKRIRQKAWERSLTPDDQSTLAKAQEALGIPLRSLTQEQKEAILKAHRVGRGEPGKNGKTASVGNYTKKQLREKARILAQAGFSKNLSRDLIRKGVVGDRMQLAMTGKRGYDLFREGFNEGKIKGNNQYVSFIDEGGQRQAGKIVSFDDESIFVKTSDGIPYQIDGKDLNDIRVSATARKNFVQQALHEGRFIGDNQYISIPDQEGRRISAKVFSVNENGIFVQSLDGKTYRIDEDHFEDIQVSATAKEYFIKKVGASDVLRNHKMNAKIIDEYISISLSRDRIHFDMNHPSNRSFVTNAIFNGNEGLQRVGVKPKDFNPDNPRHRKKIFDVWQNDIVPKIASKEKENYGRKRGDIIDGFGGRAAIGDITSQEAAVCRELSIAGHIFFAEYGLTSRVVTGSIPGGRHAWIEVINPKTHKVMAIIDSNYTESVHPNYEDYTSQIMRHYTSRRDYDHGTFVKYKRAVDENNFVDNNEHMLVKPTRNRNESEPKRKTREWFKKHFF